MKLLEIIPGYETSHETLAIAKEWGKSIGEDVIVVNEAPACMRVGVITFNRPKAFDAVNFEVHPANEYLQDEKGQYLSAVHSPCGGFLTFLP